MEPIPPSLRHFGPVSKESFGVLGGQIYYRLFEGDSVDFLTDKVRWIRVTHRPKIIDIGNNNRWDQNFIPHFLETNWDEFKKKENTE